MARSILDHNSDAMLPKINLTSVILSNPLVNPGTQRPKIADLATSIGLVSGVQIDQLNMIGRQCAAATYEQPELAYTYCNNITDYIAAVSAGVSSFDVRTFTVHV